jgi:TIR domain
MAIRGGEMQHSIFISYRRDDTADVAGRIYDRLADAFTEDAIFKDVDSLPVGRDFGEFIIQSLSRCQICLCLIGPAWITVKDQTGVPRLLNAEDWVRIEIETALKLGVQVVPVLINGATMPRAEQLPPKLVPLLRLNAAIVRRDPDFRKDMAKLVTAIQTAEQTGRVEVAGVAQAEQSGARAWSFIDGSLDPDDYRDFQRIFGTSAEVLYASRHLRQLLAWEAVDKLSPEAIEEFLGKTVFPGLEDAARKTLHAVRHVSRPKVEAPLPEVVSAPETTSTYGSYENIHAMIEQRKLEEAEILLNAARDSAKGEDLAILTSLAGDHAAAAGTVSHAKWMWRLAINRFAELDKLKTPAAKLTAASLRAAS